MKKKKDEMRFEWREIDKSEEQMRQLILIIRNICRMENQSDYTKILDIHELTKPYCDLLSDIRSGLK